MWTVAHLRSTAGRDGTATSTPAVSPLGESCGANVEPVPTPRSSASPNSLGTRARRTGRTLEPFSSGADRRPARQRRCTPPPANPRRAPQERHQASIVVVPELRRCSGARPSGQGERHAARPSPRARRSTRASACHVPGDGHGDLDDGTNGASRLVVVPRSDHVGRFAPRGRSPGQQGRGAALLDRDTGAEEGSGCAPIVARHSRRRARVILADRDDAAHTSGIFSGPVLSR